MTESPTSTSFPRPEALDPGQGAVGASQRVPGEKARKWLSSVWVALDLKTRAAGPSYFRQCQSSGPGQMDVKAREEAEVAGWVAGREGWNQGDRCVDGALEADERGQ